MSDLVSVRVPGSTSNLGAGFDCIGVAVPRALRVTAELANDTRVERDGTLAQLDVPAADDRIVLGFNAACTYAGAAPAAAHFRATSNIPVARGLGSSAAATVAGAAAANVLLDLELTDHDLIRIATRVEGHPDNAAPCVVGGALLSISAGDALSVTELHVHDELAFVFAVPDFTVETRRARALLPAQVSHATAVRAAALGAALVHGLANADGERLALALDDVLHVPYRRELVKGFDAVVEAARAAGAYGATLSGSGPTLVAVARAANATAVEEAMRAAWQQTGVTAETFSSGARVEGYSAIRIQSNSGGLHAGDVPSPDRSREAR